MSTLAFYSWVARFGRLSYRTKIMLMAFVGTHVPLLAIIVFSVLRTADDLATVLWTIGVALVATLLGTAATLLVLNGMLQPVLMTSKVLRRYRTAREIMPLPTGYTDEAGTLMADAAATLNQLEASLVELETTDRATGLFNRAKLGTLIASKMALGPVAVAAIRVGNFQQIRSTYDQKTADRFMSELAQRIELQHGAVLGRIDEEHLGVLADGDVLAGTAATLVTTLSRPVMVEGVSATPDLAIGIAVSPEDGSTAEALIDNAVAATPLAGETRAVSFHSPTVREEAKQRFALEQELRQAITGDQFTLHFQPVVDLALGRAVGAEALIRWQHPEHGLIAPSRFIPIAERSGLIDDIGQWVIGEACRQVGRWREEGLDPLKVAVNLSARQFLDPRLLGVLGDAIADARIGAESLEIELTESAAMADTDYTRRTFGRLNDLGVSIAIDDFGTGYASMSYLRKLPFSKLKIDREFVTDVDKRRGEQAICEAMIALSRGLGLSVLAEGTERAEEVAFLSANGCNLFQGYYFSKPVPAAEMPATLRGLAQRLDAEKNVRLSA